MDRENRISIFGRSGLYIRPQVSNNIGMGTLLIGHFGIVTSYSALGVLVASFFRYFVHLGVPGCCWCLSVVARSGGGRCRLRWGLVQPPSQPDSQKVTKWVWTEGNYIPNQCMQSSSWPIKPRLSLTVGSTESSCLLWTIHPLC